MKIIKFEGSPEEFKAVAYLFEGVPPANRDKDSEFAIEPKEAIRAMLTRLPISDNYEILFKALANGRLTEADLLAKTGWSKKTKSSVYGGLGKRIKFTKEIKQAGLPSHSGAILEWEDGYVKLKDYAMVVLKEEGVI